MYFAYPGDTANLPILTILGTFGDFTDVIKRAKFRIDRLRAAVDPKGRGGDRGGDRHHIGSQIFFAVIFGAWRWQSQQLLHDRLPCI